VRVRGANLTLIVYDELCSWSRTWSDVIRRGGGGGDELQLDGARVGDEHDLLAMLAAARRHAATTGAVSNHRHVVARRLLRPGRRVVSVDERQQRHVDSLSVGGAHLPRARRRPDTGAGRHRARHVR